MLSFNLQLSAQTLSTTNFVQENSKMGAEVGLCK